MADVIKFEFDHPVEVALRFAEPRVFPSQFEGGDDRHMFSTTDGRVMYVTPLTSARIAALHLAQGECFFICKRKNGRLTEFAVSREPMAVQPAAPQPVRPPASFKSKLPERLYASALAQEPAPSPTLEQQLQASIDMVNRRKAGEQGDGTLAVMAPPAPPAPVKAANGVGFPASRLAGLGGFEQDSTKRLAPAVAEFSARLVLETNALVDCYAAALKTASERHGNSVKPDDVRSLLVTAYINASKQGGRNAA
jgi:hypothetical protein